jgi:dienelactone hydrolase
MRLMTVLLALAWPTLLWAQGTPPAELTALFRYDATFPLDVRDSIVEEADGVVIHALTYASPVSGRVTAYLVRPATAGRHPAVLFGHWGYGDKMEFLAEARLYARLGAVSLMIDYPWVRPAPWRRDEGSPGEPEVDRDVHIQAVVDLRRGLDLLAARPDVDSGRLAYVGHSYGAQWGAVLSATERRLRAVVLMAGVPDDRAILLDSNDPAMVAYRSRWSPEQVERYLEVNGVLNAVRYVPYAAPTPLLLQFARFERLFDETAMRRYAAAASEPKTVLWYPTGHELNDPQALLDRAVWIGRRLGLGPVEAEFSRMLGVAGKR